MQISPLETVVWNFNASSVKKREREGEGGRECRRGNISHIYYPFMLLREWTSIFQIYYPMKFSVCCFTEKQNKNIISLYNAVFEYLQTTNIFCFLFFAREKKKFHPFWHLLILWLTCSLLCFFCVFLFFFCVFLFFFYFNFFQCLACW